jgi:hypothetical protein
MRPASRYGLALTTTLLLAAGAAACSADGAAGEDSEDALTTNCEAETGNYREWCRERNSRQSKIDEFLRRDDALKTFTSGALGVGPIPLAMFRLFPELFPEIWGKDFSAIGLSPNPFRRTSLPLGFAASVSDKPIAVPGRDPVSLATVALNCAACHVGRVVDEAGQTHFAVGAPNTTISRPGFLVALTATDPRFTADAFRNALAAKPSNWLYDNDSSKIRQEEAERAVLALPGVMEGIVAAMVKESQGYLGRFKTTLGAVTYAAPDAPDALAPTRGSMEVIGLLFMRIDPKTLTPEQLAETMPKGAALIDPPSIWNQRGRPAGNWDGSMRDLFYRNVGAAVATSVNPMDFGALHALTDFVRDLPPAPYPFKVDMAQARRGEALYGRYCASCHSSLSRVVSVEQIGTDPNLARELTPVSVDIQRKRLTEVCTDARYCKKPDGSPVPSNDILEQTGGYAAAPLDGIWARAPYFHNGSVPTLRALLTGDRPVTFNRGDLTYDQKDVGFTWNRNSAGTVVYETTRAGNSNRGHGPSVNGKDWSQDTEGLEDLLEYLKTL